jgi:hypothetical protein
MTKDAVKSWDLDAQRVELADRIGYLLARHWIRSHTDAPPPNGAAGTDTSDVPDSGSIIQPPEEER